jgi:hypothetical protein
MAQAVGLAAAVKWARERVPQLEGTRVRVLVEPADDTIADPN